MAELSAITTPDLVNAASELEASLAEFRRALKANGYKATTTPVFDALRRWRSDKARTAAMPPYVIATDAMLHAIEKAKPKDVASLGDVKVFGPTRANTYGPEILQVLATAQ